MKPEDVPAEIVAKAVAARWEGSAIPEEIRERVQAHAETSARRIIAAVWDDVRAAP